MNEEIGSALLNGMEFSFFIAMFILAVLGVAVFFLKEVYNGIKYDKRTPDQFSFKVLFKMSAIRFALGIIGITVSIIYFGEMSKLIFGITEPLELNGFVAFMLGIGIDKIIDGLLGAGKEGTILVKANKK